jgi:hypothetical protein
MLPPPESWLIGCGPHDGNPGHVLAIHMSGTRMYTVHPRTSAVDAGAAKMELRAMGDADNRDMQRLDDGTQQGAGRRGAVCLRFYVS